MSELFLTSAFTRTSGKVLVDMKWIDDKTEEHLKLLDAKNLISIGPGNFGMKSVRALVKGQELVGTATKDEKLTEVGSGSKGEAERALWAWLLLTGGKSDFYGGSPTPYDEKTLHVLSCGLDLDTSSPVHDDTWSTFDGTEAPAGTEHGVGGRAHCRCGLVTSHKVVARVGNVVDLLKGALNL